MKLVLIDRGLKVSKISPEIVSFLAAITSIINLEKFRRARSKADSAIYFDTSLHSHHQKHSDC